MCFLLFQKPLKTNVTPKVPVDPSPSTDDTGKKGESTKRKTSDEETDKSNKKSKVKKKEENNHSQLFWNQSTF